MKTRKAFLTLCTAAACSIMYPMNTTAEIHDKDALIFVCQDEAAIEKALARYIQDNHDISANFKFSKSDPDDLYLTYTLGGQKAPKIIAIVDTHVSARDSASQTVKERCIMVKAVYVIPKEKKTAANKIKLLELNNAAMVKRFAPGCVKLDSDMDIWMQTNINIPHKDIPIHAEMVWDTLVRIMDSWNDYYSDLSEVLGLPEHVPED